MMDVDEKIKCFQDAFVLARTDQSLTKADIEVFKKLRGFLADDIVDKIDNFQPGRKGILLIGDNFDLLDGIVSYIWYKHPLIYPMVGNKVTGNALRSWLAYKNVAGHKEHAISDLLFSKNLLSHMHGGVLFLKNINPAHTDLLERIVGTLQDVNCRPLIREKRSRIIRYSSIEDEIDGAGIQRREEQPKFKLMPGILVMSVKKRLPAEYLRQFQEIPPDGEEERQEVIHSTKKDKGKEQRNPKGIIPVVVPGGTKWSIDKKSKSVLYDKKYPIKLTDLELAIFSCLHKHIAKYVKVDILEKCWKSNKPNYKNFVSDSISKIRSKIKSSLKKHGVLLDNDIFGGNERAPKRITKYKLLP